MRWPLPMPHVPRLTLKGRCDAAGSGFSSAFAQVLSTPGIEAIVNLTQYPVGHYLNASAGGPFTYCRHGGWPECELQAAFLCAREQAGGKTMFDLGECVNNALGFAKDPATFPDYDLASNDLLPKCARQLGIDEVALFHCARERGPALQNAAAAEGASSVRACAALPPRLGRRTETASRPGAVHEPSRNLPVGWVGGQRPRAHRGAGRVPRVVRRRGGAGGRLVHADRGPQGRGHGRHV